MADNRNFEAALNNIFNPEITKICKLSFTDSQALLPTNLKSGTYICNIKTNFSWITVLIDFVYGSEKTLMARALNCDWESAYIYFEKIDSQYYVVCDLNEISSYGDYEPTPLYVELYEVK